MHPENVCNRIQAKKFIQIHPVIMTDADYDYILGEIERGEKLSLKGIWVEIVMRNSTNDNNHNAILYVVFHYIMIKYQYINIIWILVFFLCLVSYLIVSCLSFFNMNWCPILSNSIKYGSKRCNLFFANGRRAYYI